jgi:hypothetical protein
MLLQVIIYFFLYKALRNYLRICANCVRIARPLLSQLKLPRISHWRVKVKWSKVVHGIGAKTTSNRPFCETCFIRISEKIYVNAGQWSFFFAWLIRVFKTFSQTNLVNFRWCWVIYDIVSWLVISKYVDLLHNFQ